ncbi:MAG: hypothetical protein WCT05_16540 [Lentisphaeria bacterium]
MEKFLFRQEIGGEAVKNRNNTTISKISFELAANSFDVFAAPAILKINFELVEDLCISNET